MSIWKSPVFYLGFLLVVLVAGALAAPFVVDWNAYRSSLENYGAKISGRAVTIAGPIAVRLFPWPRLEVSDLRIANPAGFGDAPMLKAGKVSINLALAGLTTGQVKVESIALERPVLNLQIDAQGNGNWNFVADQSVRQNGMLAGVQLDEISIAGGEINLTDARHGWSRKITKVVAQVSGAAIEGPWKAKGQGLAPQQTGAALPLEFSFSTNQPKAREPLGFAFKIAPQDGAYPGFSFDGKGSSGNYDGKISLDPVITADGRSNPAGLFKPLATTAKVSVRGEGIDLTQIHIVAADAKDAGTLIEGDGHIDLSQGVKANVTLNAPHIDLDTLAGEGLWRLSETGGMMGLANGLIQQFPDSLDLTGKLDIATLTFGGENLQNVSLKSSASAGAVRIHDLTADLPGLSRMKFSGIVFPGKASAELGGTLAFETGDARSFANWLWPQTKASLNTIWTGQRGRVKMQGDAQWSSRQFGLQNVKYELDSLPGKGSIAVSTGVAPAIDLVLQADDFDLGAYVATGYSLSGLLSAVPALLPGEAGFQKKLDLSFARFSFNGVAAQNVAVDINASTSGFEVKHFDVGSVEGAELRGNGLVLVGPDGPSGEVKFAVGAMRPQGLMRLLGLLPKGPDPLWVQGFGQTNLLADFTVKPGTNEPQVNASLTGTSGPFKIVSSATATNLLAKDGPSLGISGTMSSPDARDLLRLLGVQSYGPEAGDGQISLTMQGKQAQPMRVVMDISGLGASAFFDGTMRGEAPFMALNGNAKVTADNAKALLAALGSPLPGGDAPLRVEAKLQPKGDGLRATALSLTVANQTMVGSAVIAANHDVKIELLGGTLRMADLAALALAPWNGKGSFPNGRFASEWPYGLTGEITLKPLALIDPLGVTLRDVALNLSASTERRGLNFTARNAAGVEAGANAKLTQKGAAFALEGNVVYPISLQDVFAFAAKPAALSGAAIYTGSFAGEGYSPLALVRGLSGTGTLALVQVVVNNLAPDPFYAAANAAKSGDEIAKAFAGLNKGTGVNFGPQDLKCDLNDGAAKCEAAKTETVEAALRFTPSVDLAEGTVVGEIALTSKSQSDLPPMRLLLAGTAGAVGERLDTAALSAKFGTALINKDMEELARLQKEQQKADVEAAVQSENDKAKYDAFQAQRSEIKLQQRMIKVFAQQRALDAARYKAGLDAAIAYGQSILKDEKRRLQQRVGR